MTIKVGDKARFRWGRRVLRGTVVHVGTATVTLETQSGRSYGVPTADVLAQE